MVAIAGGVFNREAGDSGCDAEADVVGDGFGLIRVATFEVGVDGQIDRRDDFGDVVEHHVARDGSIGDAARKGEASGCGGESSEAEAAEIARRADVPWVGNGKAAALVKFEKGGSAGGDGWRLHSQNSMRSSYPPDLA